jgi:hypothetical protein
MATIINNPNDSGVESSATGLMVGILIAIILIVILFVMYGLPMINGQKSTNTDTGETGTTNINVTAPVPAIPSGNPPAGSGSNASY